MEDIRGITAIFTGDGKGKTTAALGVVARSLGYGWKCRMIQFIKGTMQSGEHALAERLAPNLEIIQTGLGFTWLPDASSEDHERNAQEGIELAEQSLASGEYAVIVLDEILYAITASLVTVEQVEHLIDIRPKHIHLILTGRGAPDRLIEKADLVTSMQCVKHPMQKGISAQKGMDY